MATFRAFKAIDFAAIRLANAGKFISHSGTSTLHNYFLDGDDYLSYTGTGLKAIKEGGAYKLEYNTLSSVSLTSQGTLHFSITSGNALPIPNRIYEQGYDYGVDIGMLRGMPAYLAWWLRFDDVLSGSASSDLLRGYDGNDTVSGNGGDDNLDGNRGSDTVYGGDGNDTLIGGNGGNRLDGGAGSDTAKYAWAGYGVTLDLSIKTAQAVSSTMNIATDTLIGIENLTGSDFADKLTGDALANRLSGAAGNDVLNGGAGNDWLLGQNGRDYLTGGAGYDYFAFTAPLVASGNTDVVYDFVKGGDLIVLENAIFSRLAAGALDPNNFVANSAGVANDSTDRIIYETDTGNLYYSPDGNGPGPKFQIAYIAGNPALTAADFWVT